MSTLRCRRVSNNLFLLEPYYLMFLFNFFFMKFSLYWRAPLGSASLRSVLKKKKVFGNVFWQTGVVIGPSVTQLHISGCPVRSSAKAGERLLHLNCGASSLKFVCDGNDLFSLSEFARVDSFCTPVKCDGGWLWSTWRVDAIAIVVQHCAPFRDLF